MDADFGDGGFAWMGMDERGLGKNEEMANVEL